MEALEFVFRVCPSDACPTYPVVLYDAVAATLPGGEHWADQTHRPFLLETVNRSWR